MSSFFVYCQRQFRPRVWDAPLSFWALARSVYPNLRLEEVRIIHGLPWYVQRGIAGITLPRHYSRRGVDIYMQEPNALTLDGLSILLHELHHAQQFQDMQGHYGLGYLRKFLICYLGYFFQTVFKALIAMKGRDAFALGYWNHPMELPAYAHEESVRISLFRHFGRTHFNEPDLFSFSRHVPAVVVVTHATLWPLKWPFWCMGLLLSLLLLPAKIVTDAFWALGTWVGILLANEKGDPE